MLPGSNPFSTTVLTSPGTMYAVPINGFNILTDTQASQTDSAAVNTVQATTADFSPTSASSQPSSSSASSGTSTLGLTIGITLGTVFAVMLLGIVAFLLWRRRRARLAWELSKGSDGRKTQDGTELNTEVLNPEIIPTQHTSAPTELPLTQPRLLHELPQPTWTHELPERRER